MRLLPFVFATVLACAACAHAADNPSPNIPCTIPGDGAQTYSSLDAMAPEIKAELARQGGDPSGQHIAMAPRDGNFNIGDALDGQTVNWPFHRFIQGGRWGTRWYVWYEYGGIAYGTRAEIFELPPGASAPRVIFDQSIGASEICEVTIRQLIGAR
jgi:hypothetical protein